MKTVQLLTILAFAITTFTACDKSKDNDGDSNNSSSFLLDRETQISSDGDSAVTDYSYNADLLVGINSELDDIVLTYIDNKIQRLGGISEGIETYSIYEYNEASGDNPSSATSYIVEDGQEQMFLITKYQYENGKTTFIEFTDGETDSVFAFLELEYSDENATNIKSYFRQIDGTTYLASESINTYDDKLNPYSLFPVFIQQVRSSKNNALKEDVKYYNPDGSLDYEENTSYTYQYNANDFASKSTNSRSGEIVLYEYLEKSSK